MNPQPTPYYRRRPRLLNSVICSVRYHLRDLKYLYYDLVDGAHDTVSAHPVAVRQCGVAVCGVLGAAAASFLLTLALKRSPKR